MTTITVHDIPEDLYAEIQKSAAAHHRSINREIIHCIELAIRSCKPDIEQILAKARRIQETIGDIPMSEETLKEAKNMGRP